MGFLHIPLPQLLAPFEQELWMERLMREVVWQIVQEGSLLISISHLRFSSNEKGVRSVQS